MIMISLMTRDSNCVSAADVVGSAIESRGLDVWERAVGWHWRRKANQRADDVAPQACYNNPTWNLQVVLMAGTPTINFLQRRAIFISIQEMAWNDCNMESAGGAKAEVA